MPQTLFTIGHSTRPVEELIDHLRAAGVSELVDIRTAPGSRRNPQYARAALEQALREAGIGYRHSPDLGGFRRAAPDSPNGGWDNAAFRGYADWMRGQAFQRALAELERGGRERPTAVMCAEAQWWRCHRRLVADALVARAWRVLHLGLGGAPAEHELTPFAVIGESEMGPLPQYPPAEGTLPVG